MKRSVTISARTEKGLGLLKRLVGMSDVVIENFSTGVLDSWGLGYDEMTSIKPDIVYVSMAGLGQTGRNKHYNTMGPIVQALSGLTFTSGLPGAPPAGWGWSYMDNTGGMYAVMCVLTALHHRNSTGEGQWVDMSQVAAGITLTGPSILDKTVNGRNSRRSTSRRATAPCGRKAPCSTAIEARPLRRTTPTALEAEATTTGASYPASPTGSGAPW